MIVYGMAFDFFNISGSTWAIWHGAGNVEEVKAMPYTIIDSTSIQARARVAVGEEPEAEHPGEYRDQHNDLDTKPHRKNGIVRMKTVSEICEIEKSRIG